MFSISTKYHLGGQCVDREFIVLPRGVPWKKRNNYWINQRGNLSVRPFFNGVSCEIIYLAHLDSAKGILRILLTQCIPIVSASL